MLRQFSIMNELIKYTNRVVLFFVVHSYYIIQALEAKISLIKQTKTGTYEQKNSLGNLGCKKKASSMGILLSEY